MRHVIIGAGPAGVVAAEHLRKLDKHCAITLVGDEPEPPYSRMAIPYLLTGNIAEQGTHLRKTSGWYENLAIKLVQARVESVDTASKRVVLNNNQQLDYDKLLVCTGSHPVKPAITGIDLPQVHSCWTLEDARVIAERAVEGSKVVLMGAGFIGCIVLEALAMCKVALTVVEMENRMVPRMMNDLSGSMIKSWCIDKGVKVLTSTRVTEIREATTADAKAGASGAVQVVLDSGDVLDADLVICATGVRSNMGFLQGSGVAVDQGVMVDHYLQTSVSDVYAAGDVAQGRDFSTEKHDVQAIQPTAVEHGKLAATNMVRGNTVIHSGSVNMNVLDTLGLISTSFGLWMGVEGGESAEIYDKENYKYMNLQFSDDKLVGASSLGFTQHVGAIRGLIQSGAPLGEWKKRLQADPTRTMEAYLATVQAQSAALKA